VFLVLILWPEDHRFNLNHFAGVVRAKRVKAHYFLVQYFSVFLQDNQQYFWTIAPKNHPTTTGWFFSI
jgi:hypothetical protein